MAESAVLDNNVVISSIFWEKGNPNKIVAKAIQRKFNNLTSPSMIFELMNVLRRDFNEPEEYIQRQLALLANYSQIVRPKINV